jgi:hypothetical protein
LAIWSRMNRREHSHLAFDTEAPKRNVTSLSKREPPKSLCGTVRPEGLRVPRALCRPRFSFFNIQFSKNGHRIRCVLGFVAFGFSPVECRSRGSLEFGPTFTKLGGEALCRQQRVPPSLVRRI